MFKSIFHFFDKLEDHIRQRLSHHPLLYALIGGLGVVMFWRGLWDVMDIAQLPGWLWLVISLALLLLTGTFVSFFIGEQIILSGLRQEKRLDEKTEEEVEVEEI